MNHIVVLRRDDCEMADIVDMYGGKKSDRDRSVLIHIRQCLFMRTSSCVEGIVSGMASMTIGVLSATERVIQRSIGGNIPDDTIAWDGCAGVMCHNMTSASSHLGFAWFTPDLGSEPLLNQGVQENSGIFKKEFSLNCR